MNVKYFPLITGLCALIIIATLLIGALTITRTAKQSTLERSASSTATQPRNEPSTSSGVNQTVQLPDLIEQTAFIQ